ncbi:hypothetical protein predicted by Glimmer/Critica [Sorangium cellulosum So ce56]|uniref:DUF1330 domain-containing protein n=1 Tax=Sorangium cellulosum (strain So ce56) TaxID=448385 RepID=A9EV01_SORC5|nr:DUF1330 domain-containing protein [Sorangium cellulosum]CAN91147.1 hypothetical protein predicted by Glimmer/Critica [Sorangium cellulosum So ce56]
MGAEGRQHVLLVGLQVTDEASYARYRAGMMPILLSHGGAFGHDFVVARVLKGDERINRVFTLLFPDRAARERFFADPQYRAVRAELFEPAVAATFILGELEATAG